MKAVILSAVPAGHASLAALSGVLQTELAEGGYEETRIFEVAGSQLGFCQGEFDCWLKTPGRCKIEDEEQSIVAAVQAADALVLLDAVTFGGHGYDVKRAQDRLICLLLPFFTQRAGLTHHLMRYARHPRFYALGWLPRPDAPLAATWDALADATAINLLAPAWGSAVLDDERRDRWPLLVRAMLASTQTPGESIGARGPLRDALLAAARPEEGAAGSPPRSVAFLVGSAKPKGTSASETLARRLAREFEGGGASVTWHFATEFVHENPRARASAGAIAAADLFVLAAPLYVDALPALATHALELIARARQGATTRASFAALINCGFPEAEQNRTALRIARHFAHAAGYTYAGGLPLGGGGVVSDPHAFDSPHGPIAHVDRALALAGPALARGEPISSAAIEAMCAPAMPDGLYRLAGNLGFRWEAHKNGVSQEALRARPLEHGDRRNLLSAPPASSKKPDDRQP